jgi:putative NADH-flavin reductase
MALVLVVGASRGIGLEAVKRALAKGYSVRALARSAATIPLQHEKLQKMAGDALDPTTVAAALSGVDAVIQTLGAAFGPEAVLQGTTLFSRGTRELVDAMVGARIKRLIAVTGLGAGDSRGHGGFLYDTIFFPLMLKRLYDDKDVQEQIIKRSGLEWTIVRPGLLTNGPSTGAYRALLDPKDWGAGSISRADVADFLVKQVTDRTYVGRTPLLIM